MCTAPTGRRGRATRPASDDMNRVPAASSSVASSRASAVPPRTRIMWCRRVRAAGRPAHRHGRARAARRRRDASRRGRPGGRAASRGPAAKLAVDGDEFTTRRRRHVGEERAAELVGLQAPVVHGPVHRAVVCAAEELVHVAVLDAPVMDLVAALVVQPQDLVGSERRRHVEQPEPGGLRTTHPLDSVRVADRPAEHLEATADAEHRTTRVDVVEEWRSRGRENAARRGRRGSRACRAARRGRHRPSPAGRRRR